jgi:hypothetical protein
VHVRVFGGATEGDLGKENDNTVTPQKWVNLLSLMLDSLKNNGHHHGQRLYGRHHGNEAATWCGASTWSERRKQIVLALRLIARNR